MDHQQNVSDKLFCLLQQDVKSKVKCNSFYIVSFLAVTSAASTENEHLSKD